MAVLEFKLAEKKEGRILAVCAGDIPGAAKKDIGQGHLTRFLGLNGDADALQGHLYLLAESQFLAQKALKPDLTYGSLGENLVVSLEIAAFGPGARLRSGDALIELLEDLSPLYLAKVVLNGIVTVGDQIYLE
ncbi:MAG: hypothetical protein LBS60_00605 [Deltaproteobacteria bacterium]|jgi:hypothetical protein|nr:hypothetical protein [Deltaproteobacteria bacterium]